MNRVKPIENWQGFRKYQKASKCFIDLEIFFIKTILKGMEPIYISLKKCIKIHKKVSNTKKIDERLRATILDNLNALLFLDRVLELKNQDFDRLLTKKILKTTFLDYETQFLELLKNREEQILIHNVFEKHYLFLDVKNEEELSNLINHQHYLNSVVPKLSFPKNKAFMILENLTLDLVGVKAREIDPLNKLKKLLDLK
ncbi:MAG: hypothetical protein ACTSV5_14735 [Promethearchaeota archaeon]